MDCSSCGHNIIDDTTKFCPKCGTSTEKDSPSEAYQKENSQNSTGGFQRQPEWKSEGTTLVLTIVLGIFGFGGIGHIYLGQLGRGIAILIIGIILLVISVFTYGIGLIALIPFAIWVIFDARKQCRKYNNTLEKTGKAPW